MIDTARVVLWLIAMAVIVGWSTVMYAWVEERRKRGRKRQMHANNAMRRRFDRELDEIRIILADLGLLDVEPVGNFGQPTDPITQPIPVMSQAAPMARAWDDGATELAEQHRPTPFPRRGRHAA